MKETKCPSFPLKNVQSCVDPNPCSVLLDFSLAVKAATLIFISGFGSAIPSAKEGQ